MLAAPVMAQGSRPSLRADQPLATLDGQTRQQTAFHTVGFSLARNSLRNRLERAAIDQADAEAAADFDLCLLYTSDAADE